MFKTWPLPRTGCVCVCVCVCVDGEGGGGGGGQDVNHSNIHHDPAIGYSIMCVDRPRYKYILLSQRVLVYMRALNNNGNEHRR